MTKQKSKVVEGRYLLPFLLVTSLFFMWGMANSMNDTLIAAFKRIMVMSDAQTSLIQCAFFGSYFCFALPAALFIRKYSYKAGILLGLSLYAVGAMLFYPASIVGRYGVFLFALYVLASGCSILETTANPFILSMGSPETATRRLNIAQALNPVGSITGIVAAQYLFLDKLQDFTAIADTYMGIGCILLVLLVIIAFARIPQNKLCNVTEPQSMSNREAFARLAHNRFYCLGVLTQFAYVGAQTGVWSFTIRLVMQELKYDERDAAFVFLLSMICFCSARFFFTWLMRYFSPARLMVIAGTVSTLLGVTVVTGAGTGWHVVSSLVLISFCMSLMFPTIYGTALEGVGEEASLGASGLVMAILGGAVLTPLQGLLSDATSIYTSYIIPTVCFVVVTLYAIKATHKVS